MVAEGAPVAPFLRVAALLQLSLILHRANGALAIQEECQDLPWKDVDGDTCQDYSKEGWCGAQWNKGFEDPGVRDPRGKMVTAETACCACGGGKRVPIMDVPVQAPVAAAVAAPVSHRSHLPVISEASDVQRSANKIDIADKVAQGDLVYPNSPKVTQDGGIPLPHVGPQDLHGLVKKVKQRLKSREHKVASREAKLAKREEQANAILDEAQKAKQAAEEKAKQAEARAEAVKRNATDTVTHAEEKVADAKRALTYAVTQRREETANLTANLRAIEQAKNKAERDATLEHNAAEGNRTENLRLAKEAKELREKLHHAEKQLKVEHVEREAAMEAAKSAEEHIAQEKQRAAAALHAKNVAEDAKKQAENQTAQLEQQLGELKWSSENADEQAGEFLRKTRRQKEKALKERDEARKAAEEAKKEALANMTAHQKAAGQAEALKEQLKNTESRLKEVQVRRDAAAAAAKRAETGAHKAAKHHAKALKQKDLEREAAAKAAKRAEAKTNKTEALKQQLKHTETELKHVRVTKDAAAAAAKRAEANAHRNATHHAKAVKQSKHKDVKHKTNSTSEMHADKHVNKTEAGKHAAEHGNQTEAAPPAKDAKKNGVPDAALHATRHMKVKTASMHMNHTKDTQTNHSKKGF